MQVSIVCPQFCLRALFHPVATIFVCIQLIYLSCPRIYDLWNSPVVWYGYISGAHASFSWFTKLVVKFIWRDIHDVSDDRSASLHDDVIRWKHFPRHWPFVRGFHGSPVNSLTQARYAELWCYLWSAPWINGWVNNRKAGDLRRHRAHYDVIVMIVYNLCCRVRVPIYLPVPRCKWKKTEKRWVINDMHPQELII